MSTRLSSVLSLADLPGPELCAARLDGELFAVDECFAPIDQIELSLHRALALSTRFPDRLIAEQRTAAWVHGVLLHPPAQHQFCADIRARVRPANPRRATIREVVIDHADMMSYAGRLVTTPFRTAVDLTRLGATFGAHDRWVVSALLSLAGATTADCRDAVGRRRNLPGKRRTLIRLSALDGPPPSEEAADVDQPLLTR